jgi:hypothetical protein
MWIVVVLCLAAAQTSVAQSAPNVADHPANLTGVWSNASLTLLQRPANLASVTLSGDEARRLAAASPWVRGREDPEGPGRLAPNNRCLIASRGAGGPGLLNNIYNSNYQIVQTPDAVVIVSEMIHDARIIPIRANAEAARAFHGPAVLNRWLGDSAGWWSGNTLVVETVTVNQQQGGFGPIFLSPRGKVTERFTPVAASEIFYAFQVEDPVYYSRPWRAEMSLSALAGQIYEFACQEGNYALPGILAGARLAERTAVGN